MTLARKYAQNMVASAVAMAATALVTFFFVPFLLQRLGETRYGVWTLGLNVGAFAGLLDMGFLGTTRRYQATAVAKGDRLASNQVLAMAMSLYLTLGLIALLVCFSAIWWLPLVVKLPGELKPEFVAVMLGVGTLSFLTFARAPFSSIIFAHNWISLEQLVGVVQRVGVATVSVLLILFWQASLLPVSIAYGGIEFVCLGLVVFMATRLFPEMRPRLAGRDNPYAGPMLRFGTQMLLLTVGGVIIAQLPNVLVGSCLGVDQVVLFSIPLLITLQFAQVVQAVAIPMFTVASTLDASGDSDRLARLYVSGSRACLVVALAIAIPLVVYGQGLIGAWIGQQRAWTWQVQTVWQVLAVLLIADVFRYSQFPALHILIATRGIRGLSYAQAARAAGLVGLSVLLMKTTSLGVMSVAIAYLLVTIPVKGVFLPWYACRQLGIGIGSYLRQLLPGPAGQALLTAALCLGLRWLWQPELMATSRLARLGLIAGEIALMAAASFVIGIFLAFSPEDRRRMKGMLPWNRPAERASQ